MARRYDASRRREAAQQTRQEIVRAALKLHWEGIAEFEPLAREAGCSLATVRKHFPSKEALYRDCTRTFGESLPLPDPEALRRVRPLAARIERAVGELCRVHEAMLGYAWFSSFERQKSPTLDAVMRDYEGLTDALAGLIAAPGSPDARLVRGLLDFLSYRALRLSGGLSPEAARGGLTRLVQQLRGASGTRGKTR